MRKSSKKTKTKNGRRLLRKGESLTQLHINRNEATFVINNVRLQTLMVFCFSKNIVISYEIVRILLEKVGHYYSRFVHLSKALCRITPVATDVKSG